MPPPPPEEPTKNGCDLMSLAPFWLPSRVSGSVQRPRIKSSEAWDITPVGIWSVSRHRITCAKQGVNYELRSELLALY